MDVEACKAVNCQWSQWEYQPCGVTCGEGVQIGMRRVLVQPTNGGKTCDGPALKTTPCKSPARCPRMYFSSIQ